MAEASAVARRLVWWLVPFAIVVAALGFETDWGRSLTPIDPVRTAAPAQPVTVALMPEYRIDGGLDARKDTVDRVLFNPTRRPAPPATQTANGGPSSMKRGQFTLTGTTVVGNTATAFLREVSGGKARSVRKGETLNGMTVAEVTTDRVRLKQGDEFEDLQLKIAAGPRTTVQPAPVVAVAPAGTPAAPAQPGAVSPAAGGTPGGVGSRAPGRPVAPPAAASQATTATQPRTTPMSVSEILAERRRAARAAAEAAAAARTPTTQGQRR